MYFNDTRAKKVELDLNSSKQNSIFRNYTEDHWFIVGDKISYQIGDYKDPKKKYRIQGFVLALGYSIKNEPLYLIGNINTVIYDVKGKGYLSDRRSAFKWYSAKEIHADHDEPIGIQPKNIGHKSFDTITRLIEGKSVHIFDILESTKYTKLSKVTVHPDFNIELCKLPYYRFVKRSSNKPYAADIYYNGIYAYYAPDQIAAKTLFDTGDENVCRVEITKQKLDIDSKKYIKRKPMYKYYIMIDLACKCDK